MFVSSGGAVYGERARAATERTCPAPASYYGLHKLAAEGHVALGGLPYAIARPSNVYGPRQRAGLDGAVVAAFVERATRTGSLEIHGDGTQTRDLLHVRDAVEAILLLGMIGPSGTWNVAAGGGSRSNELADLVERLLDRPLERHHGPRRPDDVTHSSISPARLQALGWRPTVRLADGIAELLGDAAGAAPVRGDR